MAINITNLIKSPKKHDITTMVEIICRDIIDYNDISILINYEDKLLNKYSTQDIQLEALLDKLPLEHHYNLFIRSDSSTSITSIICHEMCHLDQYERGDLVKISNTEYQWKGKRYDSTTPYEVRPWEKEAFKKEKDIWKQYKKIKDEMV